MIRPGCPLGQELGFCPCLVDDHLADLFDSDRFKRKAPPAVMFMAIEHVDMVVQGPGFQIVISTTSAELHMAPAPDMLDLMLMMSGLMSADGFATDEPTLFALADLPARPMRRQRDEPAVWPIDLDDNDDLLGLAAFLAASHGGHHHHRPRHHARR